VQDESEANPYLAGMPTGDMMLTIFQHGADESVGEIGVFLQKNQISHKIIRLYETGEVPADPPTQLIILGGQMSVNDIGIYPFFNAEKKLIRSMVDKGRPVLGICLGAQLIASAFGQRVYPGVQERGWCYIHGGESNDRPHFPDSFPIFHWHNETFDLPDGAQLLAGGDRVKNQAFRLGSAVGVQFHPEVTNTIISQWSRDLDDMMKNRISAHTETYLDQSNRICDNLMQEFLTGWKR